MSLRPQDVDFNAVWARISRTVETVITLRYIHRHEWNDGFSDVYLLCVAQPEPFCDQLYIETKKYLQQHVEKLYVTVVASDELLVAYNKSCSEFRQGIGYLDYLYRYLNLQYVQKKGSDLKDMGTESDSTGFLLEIGELGLSLCKTIIVQPLETKLVHLLLDGIRLDRHGVCPNQSVFHGAIDSFVQVEGNKKENNLEFYQEIFETPFLEETGEHYRMVASRLLQENDCSQYMEKVLQMLDEEDLRSRKYLHPSSYSKVTRQFGQRMVQDQLQFLLGDYKRMVQEEDKKDLKNLYLLLKSVPNGTEALIQELEQYFTKKGSEAVNALKGDNVPLVFVENFLAFHDKFSNLIETVFFGDQQFVAALDKACAAVINHKKNPRSVCQSPELLSKYCDFLLKKNAKASSESEVENKLTRAITIFKYIDDKDVFQKFYSRMLAKRLIHKQSISLDAEETMIKKLKLLCGHDFTVKLHRMFTDVSISADLNRGFIEFLRNIEVVLDINFSVFILQAGAWPLAQAAISEFAIPQQLERSVREFELFYNSRFSGRKLSWLHHLCTAELKLGYLTKSYIVTMTTYQMAILLLYETADVLSYTEISASTSLNDEQLSKQIKSLLESKLLLATDSEKPIEDGTSFRLNKEYSNKRLKFRVAAAAAVKETAQEEVKQTHASVDADRKLFLQAAIVRIMKERKVLNHNILIQEVIGQAKDRFAPNVGMIKKCIEALIEKEYIERTSNSTNEYSYVA